MYNVGQKVRVLDVKGFGEISDRIGYVTKLKATKGKVNMKEGFNVDLGELGIWRISYDDRYTLLNRMVNEKFLFLSEVTQTYERQPYSFTTFVKDENGKVVCVETTDRKGGLAYTVTYNRIKGTTTIILSDGSKGVAKCKSGDKFNVQIGHDIAWHRASIESSKKTIERLSR